MAFLDKLGSMAKSAAGKTGELARNAVDKTSDMIEINKLKGEISSNYKEIEEAKARIGEYYYNLYKDTDQMDAEIKKEYLEIKVKQTEIEKLNLQIDEIKEGKDDEDEEKPEAEPKTEDAVADAKANVVCPVCNTANDAGAKFCSECGTKLGE